MKALIVEDVKFAREYLSELLLNDFDFQEVIQAKDGKEGWQLYKQHHEQQGFDFIILDLLLPKLDGLKLAKRILKRGKGQRILAISSECDDYTVREVIHSSILGFVHKTELSREVLQQAFQQVFNGHVFYSDAVELVKGRVLGDTNAYHRLLSKRELQVLRAIAQGKSDEEMAEQFKLSEFTVRRHRHNTMKKLNLNNESALLRFALDKGIVKKQGGLDWSD